MKKVFVIAITMILGLGLAAFAGPLSGSWATALVVDPAASSFTSLTSTLAVDYTVSGWTFGSSSGFTLSGFSSQSFTAGGSVGAFTLSSTMTFNPMFVTAKDYSAFWVGKDTSTQTFSTTICPITYTATTVPRFLTWKTEGSISIGGVELGALFYIDQSNYDVTLTDYVTQLTSSVVAATHLSDAYSCASYLNGAGWRFKVAGSIGDISATSYTYFNLTETDTSSLSTTYCPTIGKTGTLHIAVVDCAPAFTEEYITLEGISLGCATVDAAVSITCDGFADLTLVANDIAIGGWLSLDFGLVFTTSSKATDFCLTATMPESDCFTIEFGLNGSPNPNVDGTITSIDFYGIGFTYSWNGISFTSYTELNAYSALFSSSSAWTYMNSSTTYSYLLPYTGRNKACSTVTAVAADYYTVADDYYELNCVYTERYKLWEKFIIDIDADACCGGALDLTISTWFGDHETLSWVYYDYVEAGGAAVVVPTNAYLHGTTGATATLIADVDTEVYDQVFFSTGYVAGDATLFSWAKTEVDASIGVASNITLDLGFNVSAFGWESLEVGFTFTF